jgi:hypothetical protein
LFAPVIEPAAFEPIDLSALGITPTEERTQIIDRFNERVFEDPDHETPEFPGTPIETDPVEPQNPTLPEQVMADTAPTNGKGEKCRAPKDFDGSEDKYKTWLRTVNTYLRANESLFTTDTRKIDFALSYMITGRAANWAEHFTDTHTNSEGVFDSGLTWKQFIELLNTTFDVRRMKDKARVDLSTLKHKPGQLEQYILDFSLLASRAGYVLTGSVENPILPQLFLEHLNPSLRDKIETQKEPPETLAKIIDDARKFDKSYYRSQSWKTKLMGWQPNRSLPRASYTPKARDPDAMDINRLTIQERDQYMKEGKCFRCGKTGHVSRDHATNPALNAGIGNSSNFRKPGTPYKAIMPAPNRVSNATNKARSIMMGLDNEELEKVKIAFIESLDKKPEESLATIEEYESDEENEENQQGF